jgi:hypothetical protein
MRGLKRKGEGLVERLIVDWDPVREVIPTMEERLLVKEDLQLYQDRGYSSQRRHT